jgi:hypothetical protein
MRSWWCAKQKQQANLICNIIQDVTLANSKGRHQCCRIATSHLRVVVIPQYKSILYTRYFKPFIHITAIEKMILSCYRSTRSIGGIQFRFIFQRTVITWKADISVATSYLHVVIISQYKSILYTRCSKPFIHISHRKDDLKLLQKLCAFSSHAEIPWYTL